MERIRVGDTVRITLDEMEDLEGKRGYDTLF
jgi:protein involved in polysaccharide export with SLBB domain